MPHLSKPRLGGLGLMAFGLEGMAAAAEMPPFYAPNEEAAALADIRAVAEVDKLGAA